MSAIAFYVQDHRVEVVMDTLSSMRGADGKPEPTGYVHKIHPIKSAGAVVCGTGSGFLLTEYARLAKASNLRDLAELDALALASLGGIWNGFDKPEDFTATIYQFGWLAAEGRYAGFAYRSSKAFQADRIGYGVGVNPHPPREVLERVPSMFDGRVTALEPLLELLDAARDANRCGPEAARLIIGGQIHHFVLKERTIMCDRVGEFVD